MKSKLRALIASALVVSMLGIPVGATEVGTTSTGGTVPVQVTAEAATFNVSVPTYLPIHVNGEGAVTVADSVAIQNQSHGPIKVAGIEVTGANGWEVVEPGRDYSTSELGLKEVALTLNGDSTNAPGALNITEASWPVIEAQQGQALVYAASVSPQIAALTQQVANVVFTVGWSLADVSLARTNVIDKARLRAVAADANEINMRPKRQLETLPLPEDAVVVDISEAQDGSVIARQLSNGVVDIFSTVDEMSELPEDCSYMFSGLKAKTVDIYGGAYTTRVTNVSNMFSNMPNLTSGNLPAYQGWDASKLTNMDRMYYNCPNLRSVNFNYWDTSNVTSMRETFAGSSARCSNKLDVSNVTDMTGIFDRLGDSANIDISSWNTASLVHADRMFANCNGAWATTIDISHLDFSNVQQANQMFDGCAETTHIVLPNSGMPKLTQADQMFRNVGKVTTLDLRGLPLASMADSLGFYEGLQNCNSLTQVMVNSQADLNSLIANNAKGNLPEDYQFVVVSPVS